MKLTVLNGSPKGDKSITMQFVHYIGKEFPQHELKIFNIAARIKTIEKDVQVFQEILESIRSSDGILWASPVPRTYLFMQERLKTDTYLQDGRYTLTEAFSLVMRHR
ncbi:MAG: hypothetical protein GTO45_12735 [Candidatus Aminicenantes bacterium]|nr:hypothetical protein [Candidatus Aminicenantes bacterium]NIM79651.1 hypothetical protein [Candidatus Aminicenantes bacterium]NIN18977.1 hypothetical protein [Candidatus Aminicenantes bacterium]NIN42879.1 hypothetical protein [Candidatus Aminicenantes bacterium]NIN85616.1 hypothetical protein [Candidatus Aminicenantes bacterium]